MGKKRNRTRKRSRSGKRNMRGGRLTEEGLRFLINACRGVKPNVESVRTHLQNYHKDRANTFSKSDIKIYLGYMGSSISTKHETFAVIKRKDREAAERERLGLDVKIPPGDGDGRHPGRRRSRRRHGRHYPGPPPSPLLSSSSSSGSEGGPYPDDMLGLKAKLEEVESSRRGKYVGHRKSSFEVENMRAVPVVISGATGPSIISYVNGFFDPSKRKGADGRLIYIKRDQTNVCLEHFNGLWQVKPVSDIGKDSFFATLEGNSALLDCSSNQWILADGHGGSMHPLRQIKLVSEEQHTHETAEVESSRRRRPIGHRASSIALENQRAVDVYISGASGSPAAHYVNGFFNPTQMTGEDGRLKYVKRDNPDVFLEHFHGFWAVKSTTMRNTDNFFATLPGNNALLDCSSGEWTLADGRGGWMAPTRQITLISERQYIHETEEEAQRRRDAQAAAVKRDRQAAAELEARRRQIEEEAQARQRQIEEAAQAQRQRDAEAAAAGRLKAVAVRRVKNNREGEEAAALEAQRRREGEEAAAAAAALEAQRRQAAALLPAEVVVEDDLPVQVDPLVAAENLRAVPVLISGATGNYGDNINGIFEPSEEHGADGRVIYAKNGDPQMILEHLGGFWDIKPLRFRNTDKTYAFIPGNRALLECSQEVWKKINETQDEHVDDPAIKMVSAADAAAAAPQGQLVAAAAAPVPSGAEQLKTKFANDLKESLQNGTPLILERTGNIGMNGVSYDPNMPTIYVRSVVQGEPYSIRAVLECARTFYMGYEYEGYRVYLKHMQRNGMDKNNIVLFQDRQHMLENLLGESPSEENVEKCLRNVTVGPDVQVPGAAAAAAAAASDPASPLSLHPDDVENLRQNIASLPLEQPVIPPNPMGDLTRSLSGLSVRPRGDRAADAEAAEAAAAAAAEAAAAVNGVYNVTIQYTPEHNRQTKITPAILRITNEGISITINQALVSLSVELNVEQLNSLYFNISNSADMKSTCFYKTKDPVKSREGRSLTSFFSKCVSVKVRKDSHQRPPSLAPTDITIPFTINFNNIDQCDEFLRHLDTIRGRNQQGGKRKNNTRKQSHKKTHKYIQPRRRHKTKKSKRSTRSKRY